MPMLSYEEILRQLRRVPLPDEPPKPPPQATPTGPYRPNGGVGQVPSGGPQGQVPSARPPRPGPNASDAEIIAYNNSLPNAKPGVVPPTSPVTHDPRGNIAQAGPGAPKPDGTIARTLPLGDDTAAEGKGLSLSLLFEAYQRNALVPGGDKAANNAELQKRLKAAADAGEIRAEDIATYTQLAQKTPANVSPTNLAAAMKQGVLTPDQVKERLGQIYSGDDADVMFKLIQKDGQKSLDISQIQKGLKDGRIQQADALKRLTDMGYPSDDANILLSSMQKSKTLELSQLENAFKQGSITKDELTRRVQNDYDLSPADAALTLKDMTAPKNPGLGTLGDIYMAGRIDDKGAVQRLMKEQQYNEKDASDIVGTWAKNLQETNERKAQTAADRAESKQRQAEADARRIQSEAKQAQRERNNNISQTARDNARGPQTYSDGVNGYLENFHKDFLSATRDANLGPEATQWLMDNQHQVLNQHIGSGHVSANGNGAGGVLSGAALANIYQGERGMQRKNSQTSATEIQAQTIG